MTCVGLILETEERGEKREKRISDAMCTREEQLTRFTPHETSPVPLQTTRRDNIETRPLLLLFESYRVE